MERFRVKSEICGIKNLHGKDFLSIFAMQTALVEPGQGLGWVSRHFKKAFICACS